MLRGYYRRADGTLTAVADAEDVRRALADPSARRSRRSFWCGETACACAASPPPSGRSPTACREGSFRPWCGRRPTSTSAMSMTTVMKVLTAAAAIFLPLALIPAVYGMNFSNNTWPPWDHAWSFGIVVGAMVVLGGVLTFVFRRRGWI
jgi:hypothetical protein